MKTLLLMLLLWLPSLGHASAVLVHAGDVFIINSGDNGVYRIEGDSGQIHSLGVFNTPTDLAFSPDGYLYISEYGGTIQRFTLTNGSVASINPSTTLWNVNGLALAADGNLYVTCASSNSVVSINPATGAERVITQGDQLLIPIGVDILDDSHLVVASYYGNRIVKVAIADGTQSTLVQSGAGIDRPWGIAVQGANIYVAAKDSKLLQKISAQTATTVATLADPIFGIGTETNGNILVGSVLDVSRVSPSGVLLRQFPGAFNQIIAVEVARNDILSLSPAKTSGLLNCTPNPSKPGSPTTVTFNINVEPPFTGNAEGEAIFKVPGVQTNAVPLTNGFAIFVYTNMPMGVYQVHAEYAGNENYAGITNFLSNNLIVNTPPSAVQDLITRSTTKETTVEIARLIANDSAGDAGDVISFVSFATKSVQGATLRRTNDWIIYTPTNNAPVTDGFSYVIQDSFGATNTGFVTVNPAPESIPAMRISIENLGGAKLHLQFGGVPMAVYSIECATNLSMAEWTPLKTTNADAMGRFGIVVTNSALQRFYRSVFR